jgi:hypothetical protein
MALNLEIIDGKDKGRRFLLLPGLKIGRQNGDIQIDDAKASSLHAEIEQDQNGVFIVKDLGSTNGIKINGLRLMLGPLEEGTTIQIGRTVLKVVDSEKAPARPNPTKKSSPGHWVSRLRSTMAGVMLQSRSADPHLAAFSPVVQLYFLEGVQAESVITLGYGPRKAGQDAFDILLLDEEAPDLAFEIRPNADGEPQFITPFPGVVRVNDGGYESRVLYSGDLIRIGKTLIRVDFIQE